MGVRGRRAEGRRETSGARRREEARSLPSRRGDGRGGGDAREPARGAGRARRGAASRRARPTRTPGARRTGARGGGGAPARESRGRAVHRERRRVPAQSAREHRARAGRVCGGGSRGKEVVVFKICRETTDDRARTGGSQDGVSTQNSSLVHGIIGHLAGAAARLRRRARKPMRFDASQNLRSASFTSLLLDRHFLRYLSSTKLRSLSPSL